MLVTGQSEKIPNDACKEVTKGHKEPKDNEVELYCSGVGEAVTLPLPALSYFLSGVLDQIRAHII